MISGSYCVGAHQCSGNRLIWINDNSNNFNFEVLI